MFFSELESALKIIDRVFKKKPATKVTPQPLSLPLDNVRSHNEPSVELISTRFVRVCEAHGIHRNHIPNVFNQLTYSDVQSDKHLLEKLTDEHISEACRLLGVNRDWILGASDKVYPTFDFYKGPKEFESFLTNLLDGENSVDGVLLRSDESDSFSSSLLILQKAIGRVGKSPFYRYYLCNNWDHTYWKSRAYLTSCIATCWSHKVYVHGVKLEESLIESIYHGYNLLELNHSGIYGFIGDRWYAEDMVTSTDNYLAGINPEKDNFGYKSALALWLQLEEQNLMPHIMNKQEIRQHFQAAKNAIK